MKKTLALHWSKSKPNFGDALSPLICEAVSGRKIEYAKPSQCDLISTGSLLQRVKEGFFVKEIHIWGTGIIEEKQPYKSKHTYHAVRGRLTKQTIINSQAIALGDPGLLSHLLVNSNKATTKKFKIGFVEHYKDKNNPIVAHILEKHPNTTNIDIYSPPLTFLKLIAECDVIFSSAMHGLIAADSLNIPNAWIKLSDNLRGGDFKFKDYYSIFDMVPNAISLDISRLTETAETIINDYHRTNIEDIKNRLYASFPHDICS